MTKRKIKARPKRKAGRPATVLKKALKKVVARRKARKKPVVPQPPEQTLNSNV